MELSRKLSILADAAKYDASCASSGTENRDSRKGGLGSTDGHGICHSFTPDGRCVSLLKVLLTNYCIYDCLYCVNRISSAVQRARFTPEEVVNLTLDFYRRNYIEGLFLSSGIIRNADYTMEQVVSVARTLREVHQFKGYIHLKTIPEANQALIDEAGKWADRISINIELPRSEDLQRLAPEKNEDRIRHSMRAIRQRIDGAKDEAKSLPHAPRFAPGGQSTQMIVGATDASDDVILNKASSLYKEAGLRRVYYSAFSPIPDSSRALPLIAPPLVREHRLYQADWLMRYYGYSASELTTDRDPNLSLHKDPKLTWAEAHPEFFPIDVNAASREALLRVPGIGYRNVSRILRIRRYHRLSVEDLRKLNVRVKLAAKYMIAADHMPQAPQRLFVELPKPVQPTQLDLFAGVSAFSGQL